MEETRSNRIALAAVAYGILLVGGGLRAGERLEYDASAAAKGASTYRTYCASCHGKEALGDGPLAPRLKVAPPDLTKLNRKGRFSFDKVHRIIDGRRPLKGHGGAEMPVWGDAFLESRDGYDEAKVKERVTQLTHFLASIQKETGPPKIQSASAVCIFSNPAFAGLCTETAEVAADSSPREVCEAILECLSDPACIKTYCQATTIRQGWKLESARAGAARK